MRIPRSQALHEYACLGATNEEIVDSIVEAHRRISIEPRLMDLPDPKHGVCGFDQSAGRMQGEALAAKLFRRHP